MRRRAAAQQLGIGTLGWLEAPVRDVSLSSVVARTLSATDAVASAWFGEGKPWEHVVDLGSASDAVHGWPAVLTPRWFRTIFGGWKPLEGMRIPPGPLCNAVSGSSLARALAWFGSAVYQAAAARTCHSWVLTNRPFDLDRESYSALFATLLASPAFLKRHLGLGTTTAIAQSRALARSLLLSLRMNAALVAVLDAESPDAMVDAHVTCVGRALRTTVPDETAGVVPRYDGRASSRLCGALKAALLMRDLVERFDEDWFDNPRAQDHLTAIDVRVRRVLDEELIEQAVGELKRSFAGVWNG